MIVNNRKLYMERKFSSIPSKRFASFDLIPMKFNCYFFVTQKMVKNINVAAISELKNLKVDREIREKTDAH